MSAAEIAHELGGARRNGKGWLARCCCHEDRGPSLSLRDSDDGSALLVHCFAGCDGREVLRELGRRGLLDDRRDEHRHRPRVPAAQIFPRPPDDPHPERIESLKTLWTLGHSIIGTIAERYLETRGLTVPHEAHFVLRFLEECPCGPTKRPALVAKMTDPIANQTCGLHRTFLLPDGSGKALIPSPRMMLGRARIVRLTPNAEVTYGLGICEGLEDGLAILTSPKPFRPVWACLSAGSIAKFPVLRGIDALTIFADNDEPGRKAANEAAQRWQAAGREARIILPKHGTKDFGDYGSKWSDANDGAL